MKEEIIKTIVVDFREHNLEEPSFRVQEIKNTLECFQGIVGGNIEMPFLSEELSQRGIDMIINEEGKILNLKPSMLVVDKDSNKVLDDVRGNIIFASCNEEGESTSLNDEQVKYLSEYLKSNVGLFVGDEDQGLAYLLYV